MARPPGVIRRRGAGWNVMIRVRGTRHQFGPRIEPFLRSASRNEVEEWTWRKYRELEKHAKRRASGLPGAMRFSEVLDEYESDPLARLAANTRKAYRTSITTFRAFFVDELDNPAVDGIRAPHVRKYLRWRESRDGISPRTLAKDRACLHAVFTYAARDLELIDANPVSNVKPPKHDARDPVILDDAQFEALLDACDVDDQGHKLAHGAVLKMYILLLAETGVRCDSEALWIRWSDLDFEGGFIRVESIRKGVRTKSGRGRWVPMTPRLRRALQEHVLRFGGAHYRGATSPWVFHHQYDRRRATAGQRVGSFRRGFEAAARRAKLPEDLHQHDLRHRRVVAWLEAGKPIHLVKDALGHSTVRVTEGYDHLVRRRMLALVEE